MLQPVGRAYTASLYAVCRGGRNRIKYVCVVTGSCLSSGSVTHGGEDRQVPKGGQHYMLSRWPFLASSTTGLEYVHTRT